MHSVVAVVLAGGLGTRVRHLLAGVPKPMAPVAGRPFLEWVVRFLAHQGIGRIVLSTGYLSNVVETHFQGKRIAGAAIDCVAEPRPLGTAGGFLHAARSSGQNPSAWLVMNGDSLALADLAVLAGELSAPEVGGAILGLPMSDASRYGTLAFDKERNLTGFAEKKPGAGVINAGVYLLSSAAVKTLSDQEPLSFERDVFPGWIANGLKIRVVPVEAPFLDIGTEESLAQADQFILEHQARFTE